MKHEPLISVVVAATGYDTRLPRTLLSLSAQSISPELVEILFACEDTAASRRLARMWQTILKPRRFTLLPSADRPTGANLRNNALDAATGRYVTVLSQDTRLEPEYLSGSVQALRQTGADAVYSDTMTPNGLALLPDYDNVALRRTNVVGSLALFDRVLVDKGVRFQPGTTYMDWDFWIQAAQTGATFTHLPRPLSHSDVPPATLSAQLRERDGRAKAMLVIHNPNFFEEDVVRWALAFLRGEVWVQAHDPGKIPSAQEVRRSMERYAVATMGLAKRTAEHPPPTKRTALARKLFSSVC